MTTDSCKLIEYEGQGQYLMTFEIVEGHHMIDFIFMKTFIIMLMKYVNML